VTLLLFNELLYEGLSRMCATNDFNYESWSNGLLVNVCLLQKVLDSWLMRLTSY